jgi:3-oxoacyl-[acyl-carrier-protein] synthase II
LLAGGVEELCEESFITFRKIGAASTSGHSRPFQTDRDGVIPGEGSALLMLERLESAQARGAKPLVEVCGFGSAHDAYDISSYAVRGEGVAWAMEQALAASGIGPQDIGCVIAGASGSPAADLMEAHALKRVFGDRLADLPVSAPKAAYGEAMGASGALNTLAGALAVQRRVAPPTTGFSRCDLGLGLSAAPQEFRGDYVLINCFGCDGNNASLVLRRIDG